MTRSGALRLLLVALCGALAGAWPWRVAGAQTFGPLVDLPPGGRVLTEGRFQVLHYPDETRLAESMLRAAVANDSFVGLPRLRDTVRIALAPDAARFAAWVGGGAPEWGAAFAFPDERLVVMQGRDAPGAGDPLQTLRHELAHIALAEALGRVPRWFDEGYASYVAREWSREEVLTTSVGLVWRGVPTLAGLDSGFHAGADAASRTYALSHRAVAELASLDPERPLELLFANWRETGRFSTALRQAHGMSESDFERRFKRSVRRQYGVLAIGADLSLIAVVLVLLLGPLWWRKRRELQERLRRMRAAEAAQDARERESALAALLGEGRSGPNAAPPPRQD